MTSPSDPMQLIKEALPAIDLAIDQAMDRDTTAENIQASYALKSIRAALQALTAASGTERVGVDIAALKDEAIRFAAQLDKPIMIRQQSSNYLARFIDHLASRNLLAQPVPAQAEKDGGDGKHQWDAGGERCVRCGDKDWMGGRCSGPRKDPSPPPDAMKAADELADVAELFVLRNLNHPAKAKFLRALDKYHEATGGGKKGG